MPNVMLRQNDNGQLVFYVAKKDLEEPVIAIEHAGPEQWGGTLELADGSRFYLEPVVPPPRLPITVRVRRI
jgi:nitrogen fixation protein NifT